jgi:quercetin dioxygenase-like cupin family protein
MSHISPFFVLPGEGASMDTLIDAPVTIKAETRSTNGSLAVLEFVHGPKAGPPLHTHLREDEMWYVLQGDYRFKAGDSTFQLSTGGMAFVPRGVSHSFQNLNDTPGRMLIIFTPSGMERFFEQYAEQLPCSVDPEQLAAIAEANWMEFDGPPLAVSDPT